MTHDNEMIRAYLDDFAKRVYGHHIDATEEVAAAFISRHGYDPSDADVVTHFDEDTMTWRTHIERRPRGHTSPEGAMPKVS